MSDVEDRLRRELGNASPGGADPSGTATAVSPVEEALRRALAEPPLGMDELPDAAAPLAGLGKRVARARRHRAVASAASVVVVLAFGVSGATALSRPIPQAGQAGQAAPAAPQQGTVAVPGAPEGTTASGTYDSGIQTDPPSAAVRKQPPPEVLAAGRQALRDVTRGMPSGVLRWVGTKHGDTIDYRGQIPLRATTTCAVCQDPAGVPASGAVIEFTVSVSTVKQRAGPVYDAPIQPFPSFTLTSEGTDLSRLGQVYEFPFRG